jgi:hypothetical protein
MHRAWNVLGTVMELVVLAAGIAGLLFAAGQVL